MTITSPAVTRPARAYTDALLHVREGLRAPRADELDELRRVRALVA